MIITFLLNNLLQTLEIFLAFKGFLSERRRIQSLHEVSIQE